MSKPTDVRKWDQHDINDLKAVLPDGLRFGTLTGYPNNILKLDLGGGLDTEEVGERVQAAGEAFETLGLTVDHTKLRAGYVGTTSPHVLLVVWLAEE